MGDRHFLQGTSDRRAVLRQTYGALAGGLALALLPGDDVAAATGLGANPFTLGVASGDPVPGGIVLWTRLAPDPLNGGGMPATQFSVAWRVATDRLMANVVRQGTALAFPSLAHSVHVELFGLKPDYVYYYQFSTGGEESRIGRFRTAPANSASIQDLRFALCSCQAWDQGYYTLYRDMAARDLDVIFHLGDYIYENPIIPLGGVRRVVLPSIYLSEATTLAGYRARYALFKTDPDLQDAHAACPFVCIWDDHEVENNYAGPISENDDPVPAFLARRAAAYQAYYEHLPLRRTARPSGANLQLYRRIRFGRLAEFSMLDTRQYRDDHPCGDGVMTTCAASRSPTVQMLGATQEKWLLDGLDASAARWNVVANGILMGALDFMPGATDTQDQDTWDGYAGARKRVLQGIVDRKVTNPVVIAGDYHPTFVNDLKVDFANPRSPVVAAEFVTPALTTEGDLMNYDRLLLTRSELPHVRYFDGRRHGYFSAKLTPSRLDVDFRVVPSVTLKSATASTRRSFTVLNGIPGIQPL